MKNILSVCAFLLAACGDSSIKNAVQGSLKDPDSAKFGSITVVTDKIKNFDGREAKSACATVNAKNSMGGYAGESQALLKKVGDEEWSLVGFYDMSHSECVDDISSNNKNNR